VGIVNSEDINLICIVKHLIYGTLTVF